MAAVGNWIIHPLHFEEQHRAVRDVLENLKTDFKTDVKSEPEGVRNAKNQLRTGAGEIDRVKIGPTFKTPLDGSDNLMSEWMNPYPAQRRDGSMRLVIYVLRSPNWGDRAWTNSDKIKASCWH
jgi:hypothetical protein